VRADESGADALAGDRSSAGDLRDGGENGSAAYCRNRFRVAVAVMRNRFDVDLTAVTAIDRIVKEET
jgi:hypothetical protein